MNHKKLTSNGFTLIEVLTAIILASILAYASTLALNNMNALNEKASDLVLANATAEGKLESLRNQGYAALEPGSVSFTDELPAELLEPREAEYTVTEADTGVKLVELTISFNADGSQSVQSYSTYIGEVGLAQ